MSRIIRNQLFEMINTLQTATDMLEGLLVDASKKGCEEGLVGLLAECQNCAITVGNQIEAVYGTETKSVQMLEMYCESIYRVSQNLEILSDGLLYYNESKKQLKDVIANMEQEIPDKKEIVFLPYKASMWDSLESVWIAADADLDCEAYVIPIPYFDKKADGSFGEMHYEGSQYPGSVPITDYNSYDFATRKPDMIYIHNPYDEYNLVTSVHPFFYAGNLKQYTECLVYIPYFILDEIEPTNRVAVETVKHFVTVPGVIHAHKVIVQSEKMRQVYIDVMSREAGEDTRAYWEQKIFGTGSPKLDKVRRTTKENIVVPEEWKEIFYKENGTAKKVILYNISVTAMLEYGEEMLAKIERTFDVFKECREDAVLLWRPHPLMKATIEAMRPQLWKAYEKILEKYREEAWGIYDDTVDMDRAIALCDAYYGDTSSLVQLCKEAGKPVMIQNANI